MKPTAARAVLLCLLAALIAVGAYQYRGGRHIDPAAQGPRAGDMQRAAIMPQTSLPTVEPLEFLPMAPEDAMATNALRAKETDPGPAARPFFIQPENRDAATECLTSAVYYEAASDGPDGERAVAQVVINRARHPVFPASICGVVYQGAERPTGCQFTFTCDGALARKPNEAGWAAAKRIAKAALEGYVYAPVGLATHYHTNKVVPYWASSLDFANLIKTQLFYRWKGGFGRAGAFTRSRLEPEIATVGFAGKWQPDTSSFGLLIADELHGSDPQRATALKTPISEHIDVPDHALKSDIGPKPVLHVDKQTYVLLADRANQGTGAGLQPTQPVKNVQ